MSAVILPAAVQDAAAMGELEKECFSEPWSERALREEIASPIARFFVAKADGEVVGYAGMILAADEAQITNVAVRETHRRCGIGRALMRALEEEAVRCGASVLQLEVRESGTAARTLYETMGFVTVGKRKRFYRFPSEDAVLMNKTPAISDGER